MRGATRIFLPKSAWPEKDQRLWNAAYKSGSDPFEEGGRAAHLAERTRIQLEYAYENFSRFYWIVTLSMAQASPPRTGQSQNHGRLHQLATCYVWRRDACELSASPMVELALHLPRRKLVWLVTISKRISAQGETKARETPLGDERNSLALWN